MVLVEQGSDLVLMVSEQNDCTPPSSKLQE